MTSNVTAAGATLSLSAASSVPPSFDVQLTSTPVGITFASDGPCSLTSPTLAHCVTVSGSGSALMRANLATAGAGSYSVTLPFVIPDDQPDTDVDLSVALPDGYDAPDPANNGSSSFHYVRTTPVNAAPLVMGALSPAEATPDAHGLYTLDGSVSGIPTGVDRLTFSVAGAALAAGSYADSPCSVGVDRHTLTCPTSGSTLTPRFVVTPDAGTPAGMSVAVLVPTGWTDTSALGPADNNATATLQSAPVTTQKADVSVTGLSATTNDDGTYTLTADAAGFPDNSPPAVYTLEGMAGVTGAPAGCTVSDPLTDHPADGGRTVTCDHPTDGTLTLRLKALDNSGTTDVALSLAHLDGYLDDKPGNNVDSTTLPAVPVLGDAKLTLPTSVPPNADGSYNLVAKVTGLPTGYAGGGTLTVDKGSVTTTSTGCAASGATVTCSKLTEGETVALHVTVPDNSQDTALKVELDGLGFAETHPDDNTATTTLTAVPVTPFKVTAALSAGNDQSIGKLSVDVAGATPKAPLTVTLAGKNSGNGIKFQADGLAGCTRENDQRVTCPATTSSWQFGISAPGGQLDGWVTVRDGTHTDTASFGTPSGGGSASASTALNRALAVITHPAGKQPQHRGLARQRARHEAKHHKAVSHTGHAAGRSHIAHSHAAHHPKTRHRDPRAHGNGNVLGRLPTRILGAFGLS